MQNKSQTHIRLFTNCFADFYEGVIAMMYTENNMQRTSLLVAAKQISDTHKIVH
jgi:hypothetical protein